MKIEEHNMHTFLGLSNRQARIEWSFRPSLFFQWRSLSQSSNLTEQKRKFSISVRRLSSRCALRFSPSLRRTSLQKLNENMHSLSGLKRRFLFHWKRKMSLKIIDDEQSISHRFSSPRRSIQYKWSICFVRSSMYRTRLLFELHTSVSHWGSLISFDTRGKVPEPTDRNYPIFDQRSLLFKC